MARCLLAQLSFFGLLVLAQMTSRAGFAYAVPDDGRRFSVHGRVEIVDRRGAVDFRRVGTIESLEPARMLLMDADGDRLDDLLLQDTSGALSVARSTGERFMPPHRWHDGRRINAGEMVSADLNGDGCKDLVFLALPHTFTFHALISNCRDSFDTIAVPPPPWKRGSIAVEAVSGKRAQRIFLLERSGILWAAQAVQDQMLISRMSERPLRAVQTLVAADLNFDGFTDFAAVVAQNDFPYANWTALTSGSPEAAAEFLERLSSEEAAETKSFGADPEGRGALSVMSFSSLSPALARRSLLPGNASENRRWVEFSALSFGSWKQVKIGDLNGDGADDFLTAVDHGKSWTAAISLGQRGEPISIPSPFAVLPDWALTGIGTIDTHPEKTIVVIEPGTNVIWAGRLELRPMREIPVLLSNGDSVLTDARGGFTFENLPAGLYSARLGTAGYDVFPERRQFSFPDSGGLHFTAAPEAAALPLSRERGESNGRAPQRPRICLGYNVTGKKPWGSLRSACPPGTAAMQVDGIDLTCCPLPAWDILSDEHTFVEKVCPDDSVMTGSDPKARIPGIKGHRCSKINQDRYQLGEAHPGVHWGLSLSYNDPTDLQESRLPIVLRYGLARTTRTDRRTDACISPRLGALLTGRLGKPCSTMRFRELQYRGATGDPPEGIPVAIWKRCASLDDIHSPYARCTEPPSKRAEAKN